MVAVQLHVKDNGYGLSMHSSDDNFSDESTEVSSVSSAGTESDGLHMSDEGSDDEVVVSTKARLPPASVSLKRRTSRETSGNGSGIGKTQPRPESRHIWKGRASNSNGEPRNSRAGQRRGLAPFSTYPNWNPHLGPRVTPYLPQPRMGAGSCFPGRSPGVPQPPAAPSDAALGSYSSLPRPGPAFVPPRAPPPHVVSHAAYADGRALPIRLQLHEVRLDIQLLAHGETYALEQCLPSLCALKETALKHVRENVRDFRDHALLGQKLGNPSLELRATIKRAYFGSEAYSMTAPRNDDLSKLFRVVALTDIPRFEIAVAFECLAPAGSALTRTPSPGPVLGPSMLPALSPAISITSTMGSPGTLPYVN
jgi:hypothetical protein